MSTVREPVAADGYPDSVDAKGTGKRTVLGWWPLLALLPAFAALVLAVWGLGAARAYVVVDPCVTGWGVPWGIPFVILLVAGLLVAGVAWLVARTRDEDLTRANAVLALIVVAVVSVVALVVLAAPFGWNC